MNSNISASEDKITLELLAMASDVVAAHISNNTVDIAELPNLMKQVYFTLVDLSGHRGGAAKRPEPAVPVKKSVFDNYIICLEDGKKLKMLKRHLKTAYNMSPEEYRKRWDLPQDYPMVAPNYATQRSQLAKKIGLGRKRKIKEAA